MRVLCLEDEVESGSEWSNESAQPLVPRAENSVAARVNSAGASGTSAPDSGVYGEDHLARTRLKWMTASVASERIEALRILVFSPLAHVEKAEIILHGLSDVDETVRAEAASLLPGLGVAADVSAALVDLNKGDTARRLAAADKLDRMSAQETNELADGAAIVCAMSALKSDADRLLKIRLLNLLGNRANAAGRNAARLAEMMRVVTRPAFRGF